MADHNDIENWLKEHKITEVECLVPDMTGNARGKFIPAKKFLKEDSRLPEGILAQTVTGEYSDDFWGLLDTIDGDMLLEPDPNTKRLVPWANETTGQIIHDCFTKGGAPHPRNGILFGRKKSKSWLAFKTADWTIGKTRDCASVIQH